MIIKVYNSKNYKKKSPVTDWLNNHSLAYQELTKLDLTRELLRKMLQLSENGFEELLVPHNKRLFKNGRYYNKETFGDITTDQLINMIVEQPEVLKEPIIFDNKKLMVGFNNNEIRKFLPKIRVPLCL